MRVSLALVTLCIPAQLAAQQPDWVGQAGEFRGTGDAVEMCSASSGQTLVETENRTRATVARSFVAFMELARRMTPELQSIKLTRSVSLANVIIHERWVAPDGTMHAFACMRLTSLTGIQFFRHLSREQNAALLAALLAVDAEKFQPARVRNSTPATPTAETATPTPAPTPEPTPRPQNCTPRLSTDELPKTYRFTATKEARKLISKLTTRERFDLGDKKSLYASSIELIDDWLPTPLRPLLAMPTDAYYELIYVGGRVTEVVLEKSGHRQLVHRVWYEQGGHPLLSIEFGTDGVADRYRLGKFSNGLLSRIVTLNRKRQVAWVDIFIHEGGYHETAMARFTPTGERKSMWAHQCTGLLQGRKRLRDTTRLEHLTELEAEGMRPFYPIPGRRGAPANATGNAPAQELTIEETEPRTAKQLYREAEEHMRHKRIEEAVRALNMAVQVDPRFARAYRLLGLALWSQGNKRSAAAAFESFIELDPKHKDVPKLRELISRARTP